MNIWQNRRQEGELHAHDSEQKQFPVTLMTQMRTIDHSVVVLYGHCENILSVN